MEHTSEIKKTLFTKEEIATRVAELGAQITADYKGKSKPVCIGVLKGAWIFLADLLREVDVEVDISFMAVSSYGSGTTSGELVIKTDANVDVSGRDVIIVEDIVDSGHTLALLKKLFLDRNAKSVKIAALLNKPSRRVAAIEADYCGFDIPDEFVVGYGLDFDERYRTLKDVCVLKEEAYM